MFMRVAAIIFLFLIWLRLPLSKSVSQITGSWYGDTTIKRLQKFKKIDYRFQKVELDLEFLARCRNKNVIPRFLNFYLAIRSRISFFTYAQRQSNLLLKVNKLDLKITKEF